MFQDKALVRQALVREFADVEEEVRAIHEQCETARRQMLNLGDRDMEVFGTIMQVYKMPKTTPEEAEARRAAIQLALKASSEAPFELFKLCLAMLPHAAVSKRSATSRCSAMLSLAATCWSPG